MKQGPVSREVKNDIRFPQEKKRYGEKLQHINDGPLKVNPTIVQLQAGILRERFRVFVHRTQPMETFRMNLQPVTVNTFHAVGNSFPPLFPHERAVAELEVRDLEPLA